MAAPCALVASCCDKHPKDLVKQLLGVDDLPAGEHVLEEVQSYPWYVDTKYYTADVALCTSGTRTIGNQDFAQSVQATILLFDSKQESSFEQIQSWVPFAREIDAPMQMLVTQRCEAGDAVAKARVHSWCLKHSFELIELDPETFSDDEEDDFPETTGVKRIVQSLHAHMWPNLVMKEHPSFRSPYMNQMIASQANGEHSPDNDNDTGDVRRPDETIPADTSANDSDTPKARAQADITADRTSGNTPEHSETHTLDKNKDLSSSEETSSISQGAVANKPDKAQKEKANSQQAELIDSMINNDDIALFAALGNEESSEESFEQLFEKMRVMKQRAETLPPEQRKAYAEKVAITFWKAIGGDEDEIDGLSDDEKELT